MSIDGHLALRERLGETFTYGDAKKAGVGDKHLYDFETAGISPRSAVVSTDGPTRHLPTQTSLRSPSVSLEQRCVSRLRLPVTG